MLNNFEVKSRKMYDVIAEVCVEVYKKSDF